MRSDAAQPLLLLLLLLRTCQQLLVACHTSSCAAPALADGVQPAGKGELVQGRLGRLAQMSRI
jgi:hypothetical protein